MNEYEIFTELYSTVIHADNVGEALRKFKEDNNIIEVLAIVKKNHYIAIEFGIK